MKLGLKMLRPLLRRWAREGLDGELPRSAIDGLFAEVMAEVDRQLEDSSVERESSLGGRLMLVFAAMTLELYRGLLRRGTPEYRARELTARVTWAVYRRMANLPWWIARLVARSPEGRLRRATGLFRLFPFRPPAYRMEDRPSGPGVVAFDVRRCPVAEYFRERKMIELCRQSWCELDRPLATLWGARLERSLTLVEGADHCDFRWVALGTKAPVESGSCGRRAS